MKKPITKKKTGGRLLNPYSLTKKQTEYLKNRLYQIVTHAMYAGKSKFRSILELVNQHVFGKLKKPNLACLGCPDLSRMDLTKVIDEEFYNQMSNGEIKLKDETNYHNGNSIKSKNENNTMIDMPQTKFIVKKEEAEPEENHTIERMKKAIEEVNLVVLKKEEEEEEENDLFVTKVLVEKEPKSKRQARIVFRIMKELQCLRYLLNVSSEGKIVSDSIGNEDRDLLIECFQEDYFVK